MTYNQSRMHKTPYDNNKQNRNNRNIECLGYPGPANKQQYIYSCSEPEIILYHFLTAIHIKGSQRMHGPYPQQIKIITAHHMISSKPHKKDQKPK